MEQKFDDVFNGKFGARERSNVAGNRLFRPEREKQTHFLVSCSGIHCYFKEKLSNFLDGDI